MNRKIAFLLGAGTSMAVDMPSTENLSQIIMTGTGIMRHSRGSYHFGELPYAHIGLKDEHVPRVVSFINLIYRYIGEYYSYNSLYSPSYEDICYVITQIADSESGEYDNPALKPLIDRLNIDAKEILSKKNGDLHLDWNLFDLANESINYIHCIIGIKLSDLPNNLQNLKIITDIIESDVSSNLYIYTLNHDRVIEKLLSSSGLSYGNGFGNKYWNKGLLDSPQNNIHLLKLHGSVNWFIFRSKSNDKYLFRLGSIDGEDISEVNDERWNPQDTSPPYPIMLIGTFNKILEYTRYIFADLFYQFRTSLDRINRLIIIGYGFRDKGINSTVLDWVHESIDRKLIIIDPINEDEIKQRARYAIFKSWDDLKKDGRLVFFQRGIEAIEASELYGAM
jgi:hypothetical protein